MKEIWECPKCGRKFEKKENGMTHEFGYENEIVDKLCRNTQRRRI